METIELNNIPAITPTLASKILTGEGTATLEKVATLFTAEVFKAINGGSVFVGKIAISPTSKKLYIFCDDNKWHALIPSSIDGVQMPTISEESYDEII